MFPRILILLLGILAYVTGTTEFGDPVELDDDTVAVGEISELGNTDQLNFRAGQETSSPSYTVINGQRVKVSCTTARNVGGECKSFGECYPLFKLREPTMGNNNNDRFDEQDELQKIYRSVSGPCSDNVVNTIAKALGRPVAKQNYVCCPMETNYTRLIGKPGSPTSRPPSYQNVNCGGFASRAENKTRQGRIVNGREVRRGEFPWTVALINGNGRQFCGGSLIDANHVLTAAHCVYYMNRADVQRIRVQIGDHHIYSTNDGRHETRGASNVYYNKLFSMRTLNNDVALIRLSNGVPFNKFIQPICLSTNSWGWEGSTASVAGWGQVSERGQQSSVLRAVNVPIWNQNECSKKYRRGAPGGITNGMMCAGGQGYDSCKGDSGGPLNVWRNKRAEQVGIVSFGIGCGTYPGVYARVDMYLDWINKNRR